MIHHLKSVPVNFNAFNRGRKGELRKRDRRFTVGDVVVLHEFIPRYGLPNPGYTGRKKNRWITDIQTAPVGFCYLSYGKIAEGVKFR
jgi:hypothetical protein